MKENVKSGCKRPKTGTLGGKQKAGMDISVRMKPSFNKDGSAIVVE